MPTVGYILVNQPRVQNYLVHNISTRISKFLGAPVTISYAKIDLFNNITLNDFCVQTPQHDTILYTSRLELKLNAFSISSKFLEFKKVTLVKPDIHFYVDSTNVINFQFIVSKLEAKDTIPAAHPMVVSIREINLKDANFTLKAYRYVPKKYGINFTDIHLNPFNTRITNFRVDRGISMNIKEMSATDHSGFILKNLSARFKIDRHNMIFNNLDVITPESEIEANKVAFNFKNTKEFKAGVFGKKVKMEIDLEPSNIATNDLAWFLPFLKDNHLKAKVSGTFKGKFSDLKGRDLNISYGNHTRIKGNIDISGLPDITSSFLHIDVKSLYTTPSDIENIRLPKSQLGKIQLPPSFSKISYITYKGKFTGFLNDFVAYGTFSSNLGSLESDLSLKPDTSNYFSFSGNLKAIQFDIGKFIDKPDLFGKISLNAMVNGNAGTLRKPKARLDGIVTSFVVNNYNYQNIKIDGTLFDNTYDGSLSVNDPNVSFDFLGKVNLANQIPQFNFKANVRRANLYMLNLEKKDTTAFVSFYATADFEGNNIDNLNGEIKLLKSTLRHAGKEIQVNDFLLFTKTVRDTNRIILRSDLVDAEVWGTYQFKELKNSFVAITKGFLPSIVANQTSTSLSNNNFKFEVEFKNTHQLTDFFVPGLYISKDSKLTGVYSPSNNNFNFSMFVPLLQHNTKKMYNVSITGKTVDNAFSMVVGSNDFKLTDQIEFKNFSLLAEAKHDTLTTNFRWNNWDTVTYKGNISLSTSFKSMYNNHFPLVNMEFKPSQFVLKDTIWSVKSGKISIDTSDIKIQEFILAHANQNIQINGSLSQDKDKTLALEFNRIDLDNLSTVLNTKKLALDGNIRGNVMVSNLFENPIFRAKLAIDSFAINREPLGNTTISAQYNVSDKKIQVELYSDRGNARILDINGYYGIVEKSLNFNIELNKLKINVFEPYLTNIFSEVRGMATGSMQMTGVIGDPELDGSVKIQKGSFIVNYLKTKYNFSHTVDIKKNKFILKNAEVYDSQPKASKAMVNGYIEYRKLKDIYTDLRITATNFACLNTGEKDNTLYYGQAFASGSVKMQSSPKEVYMDIEATSSHNTLISIPLTAKNNQSSDLNFIRLVKKQPNFQPFDQYEIDNRTEAKKINVSSKFRMNCILHTNTDAGVQIIFDQKAGDMIKGRGNGVLTMTLENGNFNMYGTYTIDRGTYLFTMPNVLINKQFTIYQGGTITWDGSPFDAIIDVSANYSQKTALYPTLTSDPSYSKRIDVDCKLTFKDKLMSPTLTYDIDLPNADPTAKTYLANAISTEDAKSRQFLALVFVQSFISDPNAGAAAVPSNSLGLGVASTSGFEFLSNQLNRVLSQINKDVSLGFNYRPGSPLTASQAEMMLSTQILNGRITINGNLDVYGNQSSYATYNKPNNNIVGEGDVEVKLSDNGKVRLKAYNKSNQQNLTFETSPYTQGVGIFYREDFNSFKDLMKGYFDKIFGKKEEPPKPVEEPEEDPPTDDE